MMRRARSHVDAHLEIPVKPAQNHDHAVEREALQLGVADARKVRMRDARQLLGRARGHFSRVEHVDDPGRQDGARLFHVRVRASEVAKHVTAAAHQCHVISGHHKLSFNRLIVADLAERLSEFEAGGRFLVTPKRFHLVKLMGQADALYLGQLKEMPHPALSSVALVMDDLRPGSDYPLNLAHGKSFSVLQRDPRLIARKEGGRVTFVRSLDRETDPTKRSCLENIQKALRGVYQGGRQISRIFVNELGHVGYLYQGQAYFVGNAPEGSAGFVFDDQQ